MKRSSRRRDWFLVPLLALVFERKRQFNKVASICETRAGTTRTTVISASAASLLERTLARNADQRHQRSSEMARDTQVVLRTMAQVKHSGDDGTDSSL